jgi:cytoskeleton protein RodZ
MGSLGSYLRELRIAKGMSLDEVSRATRVGRTHLEALEAEDLSALPAPVFVKGFIRAYCEFLQANPAEALGHYQTLTGERTLSAAPSPREPLGAGLGRGPVFVSVILLVVLGAALFLLNSGLRGEGPRAPRPQAVSPGGPAAAPTPSAPTAAQPVPAAAQPAPAAAPSTPSAKAEPAEAAAPSAVTPAAPVAVPPPPAAAPARGAQRLVVKAIEPTWVRVQMDGDRSVEELLPAGATREWSAEKRFTLTVGNAAGVTLELNGRTLPPLGAPGAVIRELALP